MDDLNKTQAVLLTLFVSFVTSIATGIVTVTLLEQAPVGVTQTINRVVEHTVERIIPGETKTTVKQVLVTSNDIVSSAVAETKPSLAYVRAVSTTEVNEDGTPTELHETGVVVSKDGYLVSSRDLVSAVPKEITATFANGESYAGKLVIYNGASVSIVKLSKISTKGLPSVPLRTSTPILGEPLIALSYKGKTAEVTLGRLLRIEDGESAATSDYATDLMKEAPVISEQGSLAGFSYRDGKFVSAAEIEVLLKHVIASNHSPDAASQEAALLKNVSSTTDPNVSQQ